MARDCTALQIVDGMAQDYKPQPAAARMAKGCTPQPAAATKVRPIDSPVGPARMVKLRWQQVELDHQMQAEAPIVPIVC